ncbi:hypothetical protein GO755_39935 [Spirosoma sp. HMF4905]|uniref:RHS repeat protein n=1 Tax=Spirosoma arboris TaxID=2682092 RepID=A0A7K1SR41_9BACT|nr:hypothetical protein [Spirosoma arboris]MVM36249.1 hypothetical protein [Spirosoma arboris]
MKNNSNPWLSTAKPSFPVKLLSGGLLAAFISALGLGLSSCDPQPPGLKPTEPLPIELQVSAKPDSLFTLPDGLDFSVISKVGQGPTGTLIRWNLLNSPGSNYTAYTYDPQSRLIGTCEHTSFGYDELRLVLCQGANIAQVYTGIDRHNGAVSPKTIDGIGYVSKYEYDALNRLGQVLIYEKVGNAFKLNHTIQYEYNGTGQLQLTRHTSGMAFSAIMSYPGLYPVEVSYWENGDSYQTELYTPNQPPSKSTKRVFYNQVSNPRSSLHLWPQNVLMAHYPIGLGTNSPDYENVQYRYGYDTKGRLSRMQQRSVIDRSDSHTQWTDWSYQEEFVYAP